VTADLIALFAGVALVQVAPGPNSVALAGIALRDGRRPALLAAGGIALGVFVWAVLFAFGIGALVRGRPALLTGLELLGGAYLLFLAARILLRPPPAPRGGAPARGGFLTGLAVVMTNPKAAMMWVGVALFLGSIGLPASGFLMVGTGVALSALVIYGAQAWAFSTGTARGLFERRRALIERAMAAIFALLGARLLWEGIGGLA
jgi:threonine/homoserine/homoserine lactone efflux protein